MIRTLTIEDTKGVQITMDEEQVIIEHAELDAKIIMSAALFAYAARQLVEMQNAKREECSFNAR